MRPRGSFAPDNMSKIASTTSATTTLQIITDVACTVCGCVCDDLEVGVQSGKIVSLQGACALAEPWFMSQSQASRVAAECDGKAAAYETAIASAAKILDEAKAPLIFGLSRSSTPGQRAAVRLADLLGASIDTTASLCHAPSIMAVQAVGESTCTLGEVKNRADLVVFWGCNPAESHPRHAERYSVFATGMFTPGGRADRTVVMIGDARQVHAWRLDRDGAKPDLVIPVEAGCDFEVISILRALVRGIPVEWEKSIAGQASRGTREMLEEFANRLKSCRCGVFFFGLGLTRTSDYPLSESTSHMAVENLLRLTTELNAFTRFHARRMRIYGDVTGADNVLCWQTGYPFSVNLARGYPRYSPGEYSAGELLARGEVDACLLIGSETLPQFSKEAIAHLESIPVVALDYPASECLVAPQVRFTTGPYGLEAAGCAYRMDEIPIPLKAILPARYPTDEQVLKDLLAALENAGSFVSCGSGFDLESE
jgi:formylmethanofuran dehydrogenase subunit B